MVIGHYFKVKPDVKGGRLVFEPTIDAKLKNALKAG